VGRRPGPAGWSGCPSANYRAVSVSSVSAERAVGIAFLILSYLELKIVVDLNRDQGLILTYTILPVLFCPTIIVQALKRGFDGYPAFYGASWYWWLKRAISPGACETFIEEGRLVAITRPASVKPTCRDVLTSWPTGRAARHRGGDRSISGILARTGMAGRDLAAQPT
jgi:hypothetical protein